MKLEFRGWNRPVLPAAVDYLIDRYHRNNRLDMGGVICALPGGRAGRRFEELLLERAEALVEVGTLEPDWTPPECMTLGSLPEELYTLKFPRADELVQQLCWIEALEHLHKIDPERLERLLPNLPHPNDLLARLDLGKMFGRLHRELAAEMLDCREVASLCRRLGVSDEGDRWETLGWLETAYLKRLDARNLWDIQTARLAAIELKEPINEPPHRKEIVLIGAVDLNRTQQALLELVQERVTILVFAPPDLQDSFDRFGCVIPEAWSSRNIDIPEESIAVADTSRDQATAVLRWLARHEKNSSSPPRAEDVVIGVADEKLVPFIEEQMSLCNLSIRYGAGMPVSESTVYRFFQALTGFLETRSFARFAELLRHPAIARWFDRQVLHDRNPSSTEKEIREASSQRISLLGELDIYRNTFLPVNVEAAWKGNDIPESPGFGCDFSLLKTAAGMLANALEELESRQLKVPADWSPLIRSVADTFFPEEMRSRDPKTASGFEYLETVLFRLGTLPEDIMQPIPAATMLQLVLRQLDSLRIPPEPRSGALEMLGWLELSMDDSPYIAVTGMNEGVISPSHSSDVFLPNRIRQCLRIEDNDRRYARDAYTLSVLINSRCEGRTLFVSGTRTAQGDSLLPSRLFFAADPETIAHRTRFFFAEREESPSIVFPGSLVPGKKEAAFAPPAIASCHALSDGAESKFNPTVMRVTEFKDYLLCPYRYFLRHRLHLEPLDDRAEELDGAGFGSIAHDILKAFADSTLCDATESEVIEDWLSRKLDEYVDKRFGKSTRPAVAVQIEQLRYRFAAFSHWQGEWRKKGNRILCTEFPFEIPLDIKGPPARVRGRIDRIDYHAGSQTLSVFDYKTSDAGLSPEEVHRHGRRGEETWTDLQLPLYYEAVRQLKSDLQKMGLGQQYAIRLGYILLPKDITKTKEAFAGWTPEEMESALETARDIVRSIREGLFPIRSYPSTYTDPYAAICLANRPNY